MGMLEIRRRTTSLAESGMLAFGTTPGYYVLTDAGREAARELARERGIEK